MSQLPPGFSLEAVDFDPFESMLVTAPSTEAQKEIFTSVQLGGDAANCAYNESVTIHLSGKLELDKLKQAFAAVIDRHDALRSIFNEDGTTITIHPYISLPWEEISIPPYNDRDIVIEKFAREATLHAFNLSTGPLIRALLISFNEQDHALIITGHHIVCDGWSLSLLIRDFSQIYSASVNNRLATIDAPLSYATYARDQQEYLQSKSQSETESYWINQYTGDIPVVEFPNDHIRPALRSFHAKRIDVPVPPEIVSRLRTLGRKTNTSFVTLMLASFEAFVYRVTGQEELVIGLPAAGQNVEGLYNLVGHCVNLLPLRSTVNPKKSFSEFLKERRTYMFDAFDHQQFTFGSLIQKLNIHRDPSRIPLVPVVMNVDIGFTEGFQFEGCKFNVSTNPRFFENFEIFLNASGQGDQLVLECTFNNDLFDAGIMRLRMQEYIRLMENIVENPDAAIGSFDILTKEEKDFIENVNLTSQLMEKPMGIHECVEETISTLKKNHLAVVTDSRHFTYEDLSTQSSRWASRLQAKGIKPGNLVGVCLPRIAELPVVLLGILKSGGAYVPLDPGFPTDRLHYMVADANAPMVIITRALQEQLGFPEEKIYYLEDLIAESNGTGYTKISVDSQSLAYVLYTSGSTGMPKGVAVRHAAVTNLLNDLAPRMGLDREERLLAITTISFDISVLELFMPLMHGACVHIATKEQSMDPGWMANYIEKHSIRFLQATPATYELLFMGGWRGKQDLAVLCGGEALRKELAEKLLSCNREIWNLYGPTETTIWSTISLVSRDTLSRNRNGIMSIGRPVANTKLFIRDTNGAACPIGVSGELWISGAGVAAGYLNRPELNAEKFIPSPDGNGIAYRTGDRVLMDASGRFYFLNRFDYQVKVRGYRIELGEIETALNACKEIKQSVVMAVPDKSGQNTIVVWFIAADPNQTEDSIVQSCRKVMSQSLPDYMIPGAWKMMDAFPLTPNGKINRNALPKPGEIIRVNKDSSAKEELSQTQSLIKQLWEETLETTNIRLDDDFFELGGHSILAVKIMVDLEKATGIKLPLAVLFSSPTVRKLSALYTSPATEEHWNPIVPLKDTGHNKALYFAHGISGNVFKYHALAQRLSHEQPSFGLQAYGLNGKDIPFHDMKEMAAYHVDAIRKFQPMGPYYLAGGSFGGYLAYEMAIQLKSQGHEVPFVCLFDIDAGKKKDFLPSGVKQLVDAQLKAERLVKRAFELAKADKEERNKYFEARRKMQQRNNDIESWLEKHKMAEMIGDESAAYFRRIEEACHDALMSYKIHDFDGDILLIRAKEGYYNNEFDEDLGWSHFTKGKVHVEYVSGDHNSIFWEPNVDTLGKVVHRYLEQVIR